MCLICGCAGREPAVPARDRVVTVDTVRQVLGANDREALHNRRHFDSLGVFAINVMGSPGAGKTALLEATIDALKGDYRMAVVEGDLETDNDTLRIRAHGVPAVQIMTGSGCHLDARLVHGALHQLPLAELDLLFIENVGNLVCPAGFDLGQHRNVVLLSVTEGDDKPAKYPVMFRCADIVVLSKCDLLPVLDDFDATRAESALRGLGRETPLIRAAARKSAALAAWLGWLRAELASYRRTQWLPVL
jgi:hydrogenase nickel incorporation protein HypB